LLPPSAANESPATMIRNDPATAWIFRDMSQASRFGVRRSIPLPVPPHLIGLVLVLLRLRLVFRLLLDLRLEVLDLHLADHLRVRLGRRERHVGPVPDAPEAPRHVGDDRLLELFAEEPDDAGAGVDLEGPVGLTDRQRYRVLLAVNSLHLPPDLLRAQ